MHLEVGDEVVCYLSDRGLRKGARKKLEGKTLRDLFPETNTNGIFKILLNGVDAGAVPVVVLPDDEYLKKFPKDSDDEDYEGEDSDE